jgi:gliding motility-associated-like protein
MKYLLLHIFFLLSFSSGIAQNIPKQWVFDEYAGVDFNFNPPRGFRSAINNSEGTAMITDSNGQLILYTDGRTVFNRYHQIIENGRGLKSNYSSEQSALIIKIPNTYRKYYIFTSEGAIPGYKMDTGICYSIVDMNLNNGLGKVTVKNVNIVPKACEKLTAVKHCNNQDVWVICSGYGNDSIYSFLLTEYGLKKPVISRSGYVLNDVYPYFQRNATGFLVANSNGDFIASTYTIMKKKSKSVKEIKIALYSFNKSTGKLKYFLTFDTDKNETPYSIDFSRNNRFIYFGCISFDNPGIKQYDLSSMDTSIIKASGVFITSKVNEQDFHQIMDISMGPNNKIYILLTHKYDKYLGVIPYPDLKAPACGLEHKAVSLENGTKTRQNLPNITQALNEMPPVSISNKCAPGNFTFFSNACQKDSIHWYIDDVFITSTIVDSIQYFISEGGEKQIKTILFNNLTTDTVSFIHYFYGIPDITEIRDTFICEGEKLNLFVNSKTDMIIWSTGDTNNETIIDKPGKYYISATNKAGCEAFDSLEVKLKPKPDFNLEIIQYCEDQPAKVSILPKSILYANMVSWSNGDINSTATEYHFENKEYVKISNSNGCQFIDSFEIFELCPSTIFVPNSFSPNGDQINDVFKAEGDFISQYSLKVFNKWGQLVFTSSDITHGWDGTYKNQPCPMDAYYFYISAQGIGSQSESLKGTVMLLR